LPESDSTAKGHADGREPARELPPRRARRSGPRRRDGWALAFRGFRKRSLVRTRSRAHWSTHVWVGTPTVIPASALHTCATRYARR